LTDFAEMNARVVEEFRNNAGVVGGFFEGMPLVLLTTTGARSGAPRLSPVAYLEDGGVVHVFASKAGAPDNPDWYYNLKANPELWGRAGPDLRGDGHQVQELRRVRDHDGPDDPGPRPHADVSPRAGAALTRAPAAGPRA